MRHAIAVIASLALVACSDSRDLNPALRPMSILMRDMLASQASTPGHCLRDGAGGWSYVFEDTSRSVETMVEKPGSSDVILIHETRMVGREMATGTVNPVSQTAGWYDAPPDSSEHKVTMSREELRVEWRTPRGQLLARFVQAVQSKCGGPH